MKAWRVREKGEFCATVVFAETRGKARSAALYTDCCEDVDFCNIEVHREPELDKYYKEGKLEMDWMNDDDRIVLVKEAGFCCDYIDIDLCNGCSAKDYCDEYKSCFIERRRKNDYYES